MHTRLLIRLSHQSFFVPGLSSLASGYYENIVSTVLLLFILGLPEEGIQIPPSNIKFNTVLRRLSPLGS